MAKKPSAGGDTPATTYDDAASYDVTLLKPINRNGLSFLPRHHHEMTGRFLNKLIQEGFGDAIDNATER